MITHNSCPFFSAIVADKVNKIRRQLVHDFNIPYSQTETIIAKINERQPSIFSNDKTSPNSLDDLRKYSVFDEVIENKYGLVTRNNLIKKALSEKESEDYSWVTADKDQYDIFQKEVETLKQAFGERVTSTNNGMWIIKDLSIKQAKDLLEIFNNTANLNNVVHAVDWINDDSVDKINYYDNPIKQKYNVAFLNLSYDENYTPKVQDTELEAAYKEIDEEKDLTEGQKQDLKLAYLIKNATKIICKDSVESSLGMTNLFNQIHDMNKLIYLANTATSYISVYINAITGGNTDTMNYFGITERMTREEILKSPVIINSIAGAVRDLFKSQLLDMQAANADPNVISDLQVAYDNFAQLIALGNRRLLVNEGIQLTPNGEYEETLENNTINRADSDDNAAENNNQDENAQQLQDTGGFKLSNPNVSVSQKISTEIKILLSLITDKSNPNIYGYGFPSFIDPGKATTRLLNMLSNCYTYSEMINKLKKSVSSYPWLSQLIQRLEVNTSEGEILRTKFFRSMRKEYNYMNVTYTTEMPDGTIRIVRKELNNDTGRKAILNNIQDKFTAEKNPLSFTNEDSKITEINLESSEFKELRNMFNIRNESNEEAETRINLETILLSKYLERIGIQISNNDLRYCLQEDLTKQGNELNLFNSTFYDIFRSIQEVNGFANDVKKNKLMSEELKQQLISSPFNKIPSIPSFSPLIVRYENIIDKIYTHNSILGREPVIFANKKSYYAFNNPSSIGIMTNRLKEAKSNPERFKQFMEEHFNSPFFVKEYDANSKPVKYYSNWLNKLVESTDNISDIFNLSYKIAYDEESYEKMSDKSYMLSLLSDYFADNSKYAYYRPLISSDKPKDTTLRFEKYNWYDYEDKKRLQNYAIDSFIQELNRAKRVVRDAQLLENNEKINRYDIELSDELKQKIKNHDVKVSDVVKDLIINGTKIDEEYIFDESGASFHFNSFLNNLIISSRKEDTSDNNKYNLGNAIIDYIFNGNRTSDAEFTELKSNFIDAFEKNIDDKLKETLKSFEELGILDIADIGRSDSIRYKYLYNIINRNHPRALDYDHNTNIVFNDEFTKNHQNNPNYFIGGDSTKGLSPFGLQRFYLERDLKNFIYNNYIAKANIQQIYGGDPAFYGGTATYQKRNSQQTSSGELINKEATIHNEVISDGKFRVITINEQNKISTAYTNVETSINRRIAELREAGNIDEANNFEKSKESILAKFKDIADTDGQAFTSLTAIRKKKAGLGEWTESDTKEKDAWNASIPAKTDEAVYQRIIHRATLASDFEHTFTEPLKGFVHTNINIKRLDYNLSIPTQHKNSEYMLSSYLAFTTYEELNNPDEEVLAKASTLTGLLYFMEESARRTGEIKGVDTINFPSGEKVGSTQVINIDPNANALDTYYALSNACYEEDSDNNIQYSQAVRDYSIDDYKIQQVVPEEFKNHKQPQGVQEKIISLSNLPANTKIKVGEDKEAKSASDVKKEYFNLLDKKLNLYIQRLQGKFNIAASLYGITDAQKKEALSYVLKETLGGNQKYSADLKLALSIVEGDFVGSLDDETVNKSVENTLMSLIRSALYREKVPGGPVVQSTCWSNSDKYNIRFFQKGTDGGINRPVILTEKEFEASPEKNKYHNYNDYCNNNQGDLAYYEVATPLPNQIRSILIDKSTGNIAEKYIDTKTMELNFDAIKERMVEVWGETEAEKALEGISYRIPTEARYSIANIKIVNFTSNWSGSAIIFPQDITCVTGSDFDIDKSFIMMRDRTTSSDINAKDTYAAESAINNRLFDIQAAALRVGGTELESLSPGDFSDMSDYSYYIYLLNNSNYDPNVLDYLYEHNTKVLKRLANKIENLDIMSPVTDMLLHRQNMQPLDIIGMAAVSNINHDMVNMCGGNSEESGISQLISAQNHFQVIEDMPEFVKNIKDSREVEKVTVRIEPKDGGSTNTIKIDSLYGFRHFLVTSQLCKYIGASADAAKNPALARLNVTPYTFSVIETLVRWGFNNKTALAFVSQPAIHKLVRIYEDSLSQNYGNADAAITETESKLLNYYGITDTKRQEDILNIYDVTKGTDIMNRTIRYSDIIERIKSEKNVDKYLENNNINKLTELAQFDIMNLEMFRFLFQENRHLKSLCSYLRYNSINAADQKSYIEFMDKMQQIEDVKIKASDKEITHFNGIYDENEDIPFIFERNFPNIETILKAQKKLTGDLIYNNMKTYHNFYEGASSILPDKFKTVEHKTRMKSQMKNYLLTRSYDVLDNEGTKYKHNPIIDMGNAKVRAKYQKTFAKDFKTTMDSIKINKPELYKEYLKNNSFLNALHIEPIYKDVLNEDNTVSQIFSHYDLVSDVNGLNSDDRQRVMNDWGVLLDLNSGNAVIDKTFKEFAVNAAFYFMYRGNGFDYSSKSPIHLMPLSVELALPKYMEAMKSDDFFAANREDINEFTTQYVLNNIHKSSKFPIMKIESLSRLISQANGKITLQDGREFTSNNFNELQNVADNDGVLEFDYAKLIKTADDITKYAFMPFITRGGDSGNDVFINSIFKLGHFASEQAIIFKESNQPKDNIILTNFKDINPGKAKLTAISNGDTQIAKDNRIQSNSSIKVKVEFHIVPTMGEENEFIDYRSNYNPNDNFEDKLYSRFNEETNAQEEVIQNPETSDEVRNSIMQDAEIIQQAATELAKQAGISDGEKAGYNTDQLLDTLVDSIINSGSFTTIKTTKLMEKGNKEYLKKYLKQRIEQKIEDNKLCGNK